MVIKVLVYVFVIAVGAFFVQAANWTPFVPPPSPPASDPETAGLTDPFWQFLTGVEPRAFGLTGVFVAAAVVFFAYSGFEAVANLGEETNPKRDMPLGLLGGSSSGWPSAWPCTSSAGRHARSAEGTERAVT